MINEETKIIAVSMGKVIGLYEFVNSDNINATFISESGNNLVVDKNINDDKDVEMSPVVVIHLPMPPQTH